MTRQVTDQLYIDLEYFTPEDYHVYTAEAASSVTTTATVTCVIGKLVDATITTEALFTPSFSAQATKNSFAVLDVVATISAVPTINRSTSITLDSIVTQSLQSIRVRNSQATIACEVTVTAQVESAKNADASFSSTSTQTTQVDKFTGIIASLSSSATQTATADKFVTTSANLTSAFTQTVVADVTIELSSSITSSASLTATGLRIKDSAVACEALFTPSVSVEVTKNSFAVLDSVASLSVDISKLVSATANITSAITSTVSGQVNKLFASALSTTATVTATGLRPSRFPTITATTTPRYTDVGFSTSTKKFGTASLYAASTSGSAEIRPKSNAVWDGTNFKTFADGYTWTSSDGITWTRAANNLSIGNFYPKVKYLNSNWIFVEAGLIYYSSNGTTWSTQNPGVGGGFTFENINYYSGFFYISGFGSGVGRFAVYRSSTITGTYTVAYQSGTISDYTKSTDIILNASGLAVAYSRYNGSTYSNFLVYGSATTWTQGTIDTGVSVEANKIAHDGTTYGVTFNRNSTTIKKSTTGATSSWSASSASISTQPIDIAYKNSKWIVTDQYKVYAGTTVDNVSAVLTNNFNPAYDNITGVEYGASKWLYVKNGSALYSSNSTAWSEDDIESVVNMPGYVDVTLGDNTDYSQFGTMDFWLNNAGGYARILSKFNYGSGNYFITLDTNTIEFTGYGGSLSGAVSSGWNHIRISSSGGTLSLYVNGTRTATGSGSLTSTTGALRFFGQASTSTVYIDEFLITDEVLTAPSATSFTVPTGEFANTTSTDLLLHFNGNFVDDSELPKVFSVSAALTSAATVSASATAQVEASASMSSTASQSVTVVKTAGFDSAISSAFTLTANGEELAEEATANLNAEFATSVDASVTRLLDANIASQAAVSATALRIQQGVIATDAVFSELVAAAKVGDFLIDMTSVATQTVSANRTRDVASAISSNAAVTAQSDVSKEFGAQLNSQATQTTTALRIQDSGALAFEAFGAELAVVYVIARFFINCEVTATLAATAKVTTGNVIDANSTTTLTAQTDVTKTFASAQSSTTQLTAEGIKAVEAQASLSSAFTVTAQPTATLSFITTEPVVATQTAQGNITASGAADISSALQFGLTVIDVTRTVEAQLTSNSSVNIVNQRVRYMDAQIASEFSLANSLSQIKRTSVDLNATCTLLATISHIEGADLQAFANSTVSTQANVLRGASANITSQATLTVEPTKLVIASANLTSQTQVNANAGKRVVGNAAFTSAFAPVMAFNIIHIDPYLTWKIQPEVRTYKIQREDREFSIREETRQFIIKG